MEDNVTVEDPSVLYTTAQEVLTAESVVDATSTSKNSKELLRGTKDPLRASSKDVNRAIGKEKPAVKTRAVAPSNVEIVKVNQEAVKWAQGPTKKEDQQDKHNENR